MDRIKYPRTCHLPWSPGRTSDDEVLDGISCFSGRDIVITEKIDGEATTIYSDGYCHARSTDSSHHPSRSWIKKFASTFAYELPENWRVCGENVYAYHSIFYKDLPSYFLVYGIYDDNNKCLSWDDTVSICEIIGLKTVPVIFRGKWEEEGWKIWDGVGAFPTFGSKLIEPKWPNDFDEVEAEGYVIRLADQFSWSDFKFSVAKYVRESHVQTDENWMERQPIQNLLNHLDQSGYDH